MSRLAEAAPNAIGTQLPLRAGPKKAVLLDEPDWSVLHRFPNHHRVSRFAKTYLTIPKGQAARQPFALRSWQREIAQGLFPGVGARPRQGLISIPRGNGKSTYAAVLALYALYADDCEAPQVLTVAADLRQASIIFNAARRMVETSPELLARTKVYQDKLVVPATDGVLTSLPSDPDALQGWDPSLCVVDELHVVNRETWEAMTLASGKRDRSLVLAISTPADTQDSIMWALVNLCRSDPSPDFYFREWTSDPTHATDCLHCWTTANPALDDFLARDAMMSVRRTAREGAFRRYRLGQWLDVAPDQWVTPAQWTACLDVHNIPDGTSVVLAVDGSFSQDATAISACTVSSRPHIDAVATWQAEPNDEDYRVPVADVEQALRDACKRWNVREIVFDPYRWTRTMQVLSADGLPVVEFPQSAQRMTPATVGLYEAIVNQQVTHSGDAMLTKHVMNARVVEDSRGTRLQKDRRGSANKIDLAVTAVMAHARATHLATSKVRRRVVAW